MLGEHYKSMYKQVIQEGIELFGYMFIFYGALLLLVPGQAWVPVKQKPSTAPDQD